MARNFLSPQGIKIVKEDIYLVSLLREGEETIYGLEPKRLFPYTHPNEYISLVEDGRREIAIIRDMAELDEESRKALLDCFAEIYMVPKITKVYFYGGKIGSVRFDVETDRGRMKFRVKNPNSAIINLGKGRVLIRDSDDNRYEIANTADLDAKSAHQLFPFL